MKPRATLSDLKRIAPGGAVAIAYNGTPMWLHPDPWAKALRAVLERRLGSLSDIDFTAEALRAAEDTMRDLGYSQVERWKKTTVETIDLDFVIGHILSATSTEQIPRTQRHNVAREIDTAITSIAPCRRVAETVSVRAVIGHSDETPTA
jgi:hypothetical protein